MLAPPKFHDSAAFTSSALFRSFLANPLRIIDIGARDGVHEMFLPLGKLAKVLAFEPDQEGYEALVADQELKQRMADVIIRPEALGDGTRVPFHLMSKATNHSLLRTNDVLVERYKMDLFRNVSSFDIDTNRLDDIVAGPQAPCPGFGEIVKIDTQASEHLILSHAPTMLQETTIGIIAEVWFCEIYENQPLFHDLCALLKPFGLTFYGFTSFFLRSGKRVDKRNHLGRERALYADAIFLKDPLDQAIPALSERHFAVLFLFACMTGYFDFALELAGRVADPSEQQALVSAIGEFSRIEPDEIRQQAQNAVAQASTDANGAAVAIGRFVDGWRSYFDYGDVR